MAPDKKAATLTASKAGAWQVLDPASAAVRPAEMQAPNRIRLSLAARQALLLVE